MKKIILPLLLAGALSVGFEAGAVQAKRVFVNLTQPDGSIVRVQRGGDEFFHYYQNEDGRILSEDSEGYLRYVAVDAAGNAVLSDWRADESTRRSARTKAFTADTDSESAVAALRRRVQAAPESRLAQSGLGLFTGKFPRTGDIRGLVILVEYTDVKFQVADPKGYFTDMLNKEGFNQYNGTGCAKEYYELQSGGKFRPVFDVLGPVSLPQNRAYYGANDYYGSDVRAEEMVIHACQLLDSTVDFSKYDMDNDGQIDNVFVFYAGQGEASYGPANSVWPHSWQIIEGTGKTYTFDGKKLNRYACTNEWEQSRPDGVGTFIHEFSHVMGLPDLYHTTSSSATYTPGSWSVMDYGPYNNDGCTPPNYSVFERNAMGWIDPLLIDDQMSVTLRPIGEYNEAAIVQTDKTNEFFLFENRQQTGWDAYLPGHGMLIWHIDFNQSIWDQNIVNNTQGHQYVDIVEANGRTNSNSMTTMAGYAWPGDGGRYNSFTSSTSPAFKTWAGKAIELPLTEITEADGIITFDVDGGNVSLTAPEGVSVQSHDNGSATVSWNAVENALEYLVDVYTLGGTQEVFVARDLTVQGQTTVTIEGLAPKTEYQARVRAKRGKNMSDYSAATTFTTPELAFSYITPIVLDASDKSVKGFTANWEAVDGAAGYLLTVYADRVGDPVENVVNFGITSDTSLKLADGWTISGSNSDIYRSNSTGFYGESAPALKMNKDGYTLTSPVYATQLSGLSFWARGASTTDDSSLDVQARASESDQWATIETIQPLNKSKGVDYTVESLPETARQIRFVYNKVTGNCALDDVKITASGTVTGIVEGYDALNVGNTTSYEFTGISNDKKYYHYTVQAVNGAGERSLVSAIRDVDMSEYVSGIGSVSVDGADETVAVSGLTVVYAGEAGATVAVRNLSGTVVAGGRADASGAAEIRLPSAGFYIVSTPRRSVKVLAK